MMNKIIREILSQYLRKIYDCVDKGGIYAPHHRNPLYSHAGTECVWELRRLTLHFHPSVALFARTLLQVSDT